VASKDILLVLSWEYQSVQKLLWEDTHRWSHEHTDTMSLSFLIKQRKKAKRQPNNSILFRVHFVVIMGVLCQNDSHKHHSSTVKENINMMPHKTFFTLYIKII